MKKYILALDVPDDFNPEEMDINISSKQDIDISSEGFINFDTLSEEIIKNSDIKLETIDEHSVALFKCSSEVAQSYGIENFDQIRQSLEENLKCPVIGYVDDLELFVENADQAIDMFNGMIAKIKVRAAIKPTTGIILPS